MVFLCKLYYNKTICFKEMWRFAMVSLHLKNNVKKKSLKMKLNKYIFKNV